MPTINELREIRLKKLEAIRKAGIEPYPAKTKRTHSISEALANFAVFSKQKKKIVLTGRVRTIREHGGSTFLHFEDGAGVIQAYLKRDKLGRKKYELFSDNFDAGDIIECRGSLFKTKKGEKTIEAADCRMLVKSLLPLPEKWHGLQDIEERYRKRYLDLLMNPEIKEIFNKRAEIIKRIRDFLGKNDFVEVETPILQTVPGGAIARPFKTYLNALNLDLYLRVAPELYLKRLLVGGFERVYEIGRCFRNEGMDKNHNPDFTMLEFYAAWWDYEKLMKFTEQLFRHIEPKRFTPPFKRIEYCKIVKNPAQEKETFVKMKQPTFVINHPVAISPLAKKINQKETARFQLLIEGREVVNAFSELNDPLEQRKRFQEQEKLRKKGDLEAHRIDNDFLEALEYGMPPAAGFGMGIDRLVALLTNSHALREVILFPTMKPKS